MCVHAPLCSTLCDPMDCNPLGSSIYGISQALMLDCGAIPFSRGSSQPRDRTCISCVSCIGRQILYHRHHPGSTIKGYPKIYLTSTPQIYQGQQKQEKSKVVTVDRNPGRYSNCR